MARSRHGRSRRIVRGADPVRLEVQGCGAVKINVGETGYFRTQYDAVSLTGLKSAFARLPLADQLGLLKDSRGLAEGGYLSFETYLDIADGLPAAADPMLLLDSVQMAHDLDRLYEGLPAQAGFRAFARGRFSQMLARVGWIAGAGEAPNTSLLRDELIRLLARMGDAGTLAEAFRRMKGAERDPSLLPGPVRKAVVEAVGAGACAATFADFQARATRATDSAEQTLYFLAIAGANDPAVARRVLELALGAGVPQQFVGNLISVVGKRHPELAFDFAVERYDAVAAKVGPYTPMFLASLAANAVDGSFLERFSKFAQARLDKDAAESVERAKASISHSDRLRRTGLPQVDAWLARRVAMR